MKIAIIGLGSIAQKAYLPLFAAMQDKHSFVLSSRSIDKAEQIRSRYNFAGAVAGVDALIASGAKAAFIHSATDSHFAICKQLLEAGLHVFVDKPISETLAEVATLQKLAAANGLLLMAGFNRRFAPKIQELKAVADKSMIFVAKNRVNTQQAAAFALYDNFIHPLDTALYLADDEIESYSSKLICNDGCLSRVALRLDTATATIIVSMNMQAGANNETVTVHSPSGSYTVENLVTLTKLSPSGTNIDTGSDWATTLEKRGFAPMVQCFLEAVAIANTDYDKAIRHCRQEKVYQSHELISLHVS
ncbi:MAG: Gfo/Idh/MocA family oxidoreductase [Deferribacteraceae bacterium]|jgi:virulence factor|nr:Gfo/Idh/MocA family oxidoreductase [Deferribacteraceae bacterium]